MLDVTRRSKQGVGWAHCTHVRLPRRRAGAVTGAHAAHRSARAHKLAPPHVARPRGLRHAARRLACGVQDLPSAGARPTTLMV